MKRSALAVALLATVFGAQAFSTSQQQSKDLVPHPVSVPTAPVEKVAKATGPDARTVAEVISGRTALKDKEVTIRGKVVKVTSGILGKNWLHLQDGSGSAATGTHDLVVTTTDTTAIGAVVPTTPEPAGPACRCCGCRRRAAAHRRPRSSPQEPRRWCPPRPLP